jgi:four helix bundle protein
MNSFAAEKQIEYGNILINKSFLFGVRSIKLYKILISRDHSLNSIYNQLLRCSTSIGANIFESQSAPSKKDFINKLNISLKEAKETDYWLKLLKESNLLNDNEFQSISKDCIELIKLLTSIIKKSKENL